MQLQLPNKNVKTKWVNINDTVKFLVNYPTRLQQQKLDIVRDKIAVKLLKLESCNIVEKSDLEAAMLHDQLEYARLFIKYTVKDWEGITYEEDGETKTKCKLVNNELDEELLTALTTNADETVNMLQLLIDAVGISDDDKKKL